VGRSMERFIEKVEAETGGTCVDDPQVIRIILELYRAYNATNRKWRRGGGSDHPMSTAKVFLVGDSAIGSPYFQSISLGFECAMFLAGLLNQTDSSADEILEQYERLVYQQWLRVYMRTKQIKHNKDLFESIDDTFGLLEKLHIF
jgi:2-polyprenyl-6-methoxyphenol hydroxylase-like FAD-dependent oxidoreductase